MKIKIIIMLIGLSLFSTSCLEEYLDVAPEAGLTEEDIFTKYNNFKSFFDRVYEGQRKFGSNWRDYNIKTAYPLYFAFWDQKYSWWAMTDLVDQGRYMESQAIKNGTIGSIVGKFIDDGNRRPILQSMFEVIRICNISLSKLDQIQDASPDEILDLEAQAHFVRAFAHLELFRVWGPMPYLTKALGPEDSWDISRLSKWETATMIANDFDTAANLFAKAKDIPLMRRDNPNPGPGHLEHPDIWRPNGATALAFKGRVLLYRASPLNNDKGLEDWKAATDANWNAIKTASEWGYKLLPFSEFTTNFIGARNTDEALWSWSAGNKSYNAGDMTFEICGHMAGNKGSFSGSCPTQNTVDKFETIWGDALNTEQDRAAAIASGHYNDQNPYQDRDPRFYASVIYNGAPIPGYTTAQIYYDPVNNQYSDLLDPAYLGRTRTGYLSRKWWGGQSVKNKSLQPLTTDPLIRMAELYLNFAEAANRAYGPTTVPPGAEMSALDAVNQIRDRAGMPPVLAKYTVSTETLEPRIRNERTVELIMEGHYFQDIRRWMIAPQTMTQTLIGMNIEKLAPGYDESQYPTGFKYSREPLPADRQVTWKDEMYYFPFLPDDMFKMSVFEPNPTW